jgi:soluble lytic murein transglycosylase-like protein
LRAEWVPNRIGASHFWPGRQQQFSGLFVAGISFSLPKPVAAVHAKPVILRRKEISMSARFSLALLQVRYGIALRRWVRVGASVLLLIACLGVLILAAWDRHAQVLQPESLTLALPAFLRSGNAPAEPVSAPAAVEAPRADPNEGRYRALAQFLAQRYRVSQDATLDLVSFAHAAGYQMGLDPLLIIAVIAVESRFNPIAESVAGAKGLMQVIPKYHPEKLQPHGGEQAVFDPQTNILVGSQILKEYLARTGSLTSALQMYAGASSDLEDAYSAKVMIEKQRLQQVINRTKSSRVRVAQSTPVSGESPHDK